MTTVAIPFVRVGSDQNPNLKTGRDTDGLTSYLRSAVVAFASVRRWNPMIALQFVTNGSLPMWFEENLQTLGVEVVYVPFRHDPPEGFARAFRGSFYLLDALLHVEDTEGVLFVDPDVVCLGPLDSLLGTCGGKVGVLRLDYPRRQDVNGTSAALAEEIHARIDGRTAPDVTHYGGEAYFLPAAALQKLRHRTSVAWSDSLRAFSEGEPYLTTEEHIMNYALRDIPTYEMNQFAKRIWTAHKHRTVSREDAHLLLWHVPAEKDRGFARVYPQVLNLDSWFWKDAQADYVRKLGRLLGLWRRSPARYFLDLAGAAIAARENRTR